MSVANWSSVAYYLVDDVVFWNGVAYKAVNPSFNSPPPSADWVDVPVGDITAVVAGTGLSGGGITGVINLANAGIISATAGTGISTSGTDPLTIGNTGVLSLDGATGALTTLSGAWYKTSSQTISANANPQTTTITFQASTSWADTTAISQSSPTTFQVNTKGLYQLELNIQYALNATATFGDTLHFGNIRLSRAGNGSTIASTSQNMSGYNALLPLSRGLQVQALVALNAGDILSFQSYDWPTANTWSISGISSAPFDFDLNTYFSWTLVKTLP